MPERPLLILPTPDAPIDRQLKRSRPPRVHFPGRDRQATRLDPQFLALQQVFERRTISLHTQSAGLMPEEVIVLETIGAVEDFIRAVNNVAGLEWLGETDVEDIPPNDDFFATALNEEEQEVRRADAQLRGRLFMVFANQRALTEIISLWDTWKNTGRLPRNFGRFGQIFRRLSAIRRWGVVDRLEETGVLENWRERVAANEQVIPCEIELWYRVNSIKRRDARDRIEALIRSEGGTVLNECVLEEIGYHALLANISIASVQRILEDASRNVELVQCEQIQFIRSAGQMSGVIVDSDREPLPQPIPVPATLGEPVVGVLDGLPLQNHALLNNHLLVDDPDDYESDYPAHLRRHGTAMSSLIIHGDMNNSPAPLNRRVYIRPILKPEPNPFRQPAREIVPDNVLIVDPRF